MAEERWLATPLLTVTGLRVATPRGDIVRGVDLEIRRREVVGLLGESGCGKTTLALAVAGLLRGGRRVVEGSITFDGSAVVTNALDRTAELRGARIGFVPQDPFSALDPLRRIGPQVARSLLIHKRTSRTRALKKVVEMLDAMGMPDPDKIGRKYPHELSGGQRQRAVIASALICEPSLIVADEPTSALDVIVQAQVLERFLQLSTELGASVLLVSHDLGILAETSDRVAAMYAGRIVEFGRVRDLLRAPRHPYVAALLASLPSPAETRLRRLPSIAGQPPQIPGRLAPCAFAPRCRFADEMCWSVEPAYSWPADTGFACHHPLPDPEATGSERVKEEARE